MNKIDKRYRFDFIQEIIKIDEKNRCVYFKLIPNPKRYEWKEIDGKRCLYDKFDKLLIPESLLSDFAEQANGMPVYYQPQQIKNADDYILSRIPKIKEEFSGTFPEPSFEDKSEEFLEGLKENELNFVILSLDIANSTTLSTTLAPEKYSRLISVLLYEISTTVPLFHGHVLKYTGDGIIAYFPEPSFITKNDLAIDCALTMRKLIYKGINVVVESMGYTKIDIRIGIDSGQAVIATLGNPSTKQHKDIIGAVVSIATKIQSVAGKGGICLGETTIRNLHTDWRMICEKISLPKDWKYEKETGVPYQIYKINN